MTPQTAQGLQVILVAAAIVVAAVAAFLWWRLRPHIVLVGGGRFSDEVSVEPAPKVAAFTASQSAASPAPPAALRLAPLEAVVKQLLQTTPHIGIIGDSGAGKTTTGEAIIRLLTGEAYVVDPKWWRGKWGGLPAAGLDDQAGYSQMASGLQAVFAEFNRRRIYKRDHPEATFPDLWLIWDEINDTMEEVPDAGVPLRRLLRVGREYNVHVLFFPQSDRVKALGLEGHGDAVKNVLWMYLGNDAREVVKRLIKDGKLDAAVGQQMIALPRPAVVSHATNFYGVDLSAAPALALQPLTQMGGWMVPVPSSQMADSEESTFGTPELPTREPSKKLPDIREAAIRYWIAQGEKDTPIALRLDMRKADALELVKTVRLLMDEEKREKVLQLQQQLVVTSVEAA